MHYRLSVIIPIYNCERYLGKCLRSLLAQNVKEIEILCVDEGGQDSSMNIVKDISNGDDRIKILTNSDHNSFDSRNLGIGKAEGDYIHFIDPEDFVLVDGYESVLSKAEKLDLDCIKFSAIRCDDKDKTLHDGKTEDYGNISRALLDKIVILSESAELFNANQASWSGLYKRDFLLKNNILFDDIKYVADRVFSKKVILNAKKIMLVTDSVLVHRFNIEGSFESLGSDYFDSLGKSVRVVEKVVRNSNVPGNFLSYAVEQEINDLVRWTQVFVFKNVHRKEAIENCESILNDFGERYAFVSDYADQVNKLKMIV